MTTAGESAPGAPRVLLVEDDEIMRLSLDDRLRMEGIPATSVSDLAGARRELAKGGLDLVVTDVRLPDGSGRTLFEEVCRQHPGTPVILITGAGCSDELIYSRSSIPLIPGMSKSVRTISISS